MLAKSNILKKLTEQDVEKMVKMTLCSPEIDSPIISMLDMSGKLDRILDRVKEIKNMLAEKDTSTTPMLMPIERPSGGETSSEKMSTEIIASLTILALNALFLVVILVVTCTLLRDINKLLSKRAPVINKHTEVNTSNEGENTSKAQLLEQTTVVTTNTAKSGRVTIESTRVVNETVNQQGQTAQSLACRIFRCRRIKKSKKDPASEKIKCVEPFRMDNEISHKVVSLIAGGEKTNADPVAVSASRPFGTTSTPSHSIVYIQDI